MSFRNREILHKNFREHGSEQPVLEGDRLRHSDEEHTWEFSSALMTSTEANHNSGFRGTTGIIIVLGGIVLVLALRVYTLGHVSARNEEELRRLSTNLHELHEEVSAHEYKIKALQVEMDVPGVWTGSINPGVTAQIVFNLDKQLRIQVTGEKSEVKEVRGNWAVSPHGIVSLSVRNIKQAPGDLIIFHKAQVSMVSKNTILFKVDGHSMKFRRSF